VSNSTDGRKVCYSPNRKEVEPLTSNAPPTHYTVGEAARRLGVPRGVIKRAISSGKLQAVRYGSRAWWRIAADDLDRFREEHKKTAAPLES
jgi:excisionase family DNA binding protein